MAATLHLPLAPKSRPDAVLRPGAHPDPRRLDRPRLHRRPTPPASRSSPSIVAEFTPERVAAATRHRRVDAASTSPGLIHEGQARLVLVDDGRQPELRRGPHRAGHHQSGPDDRQHRPARHRRQLDHRPVQRDGLAAVQQHDEPARRPRLSQRRASRRRSPAFSASTQRAFPSGTVGPTTRSSKAFCAARSRACGSSPPTRPIPGSTSTCSATFSRGSISWSCRTCTRRPRRPSWPHLVLPAAAWGEKEGTFINSERRIGLIKKVARAPGQALADFRSSSWSPSTGAAATCSRDGPARKPCSRSSRNSRAASPATSRASPTTDARRARRHSVALSRAERRSGSRERRLFADGKFLSCRRPGQVLFEQPRRDARAAERPVSAAAADRPRHRRRSGTRKRGPQIGRAAQALSGRDLRRNQPGRRPPLAASSRTSAWSSSRSAARSSPRRLSPTPCSRDRSFLPMHYEQTNRLTLAHFDPYSRQPSYKNCAVARSPRRDERLANWIRDSMMTTDHSFTEEQQQYLQGFAAGCVRAAWPCRRLRQHWPRATAASRRRSQQALAMPAEFIGMPRIE